MDTFTKLDYVPSIAPSDDLFELSIATALVYCCSGFSTITLGDGLLLADFGDPLPCDLDEPVLLSVGVYTTTSSSLSSFES